MEITSLIGMLWFNYKTIHYNAPGKYNFISKSSISILSPLASLMCSLPRAGPLSPWPHHSHPGLPEWVSSTPSIWPHWIFRTILWDGYCVDLNPGSLTKSAYLKSCWFEVAFRQPSVPVTLAAMKESFSDRSFLSRWCKLSTSQKSLVNAGGVLDTSGMADSCVMGRVGLPQDGSSPLTAAWEILGQEGS